MSINEKALLVKLSVSQWYNRAIDRKVTDEIAQKYEVTEQEDKYVKTLLPRVAVRNIQRAISDLRTFHYANTLPWQDDSVRILSSGNFFQYQQGIAFFIGRGCEGGQGVEKGSIDIKDDCSYLIVSVHVLNATNMMCQTHDKYGRYSFRIDPVRAWRVNRPEMQENRCSKQLARKKSSPFCKGAASSKSACWRSVLGSPRFQCNK